MFVFLSGSLGSAKGREVEEVLERREGLVYLPPV